MYEKAAAEMATERIQTLFERPETHNGPYFPYAPAPVRERPDIDVGAARFSKRKKRNEKIVGTKRGVKTDAPGAAVPF